MQILSNGIGMDFEVFLFARLREIVGEPSLVIHGQEIQTVADVWTQVCDEFPAVKSLKVVLTFCGEPRICQFAVPGSSGG